MGIYCMLIVYKNKCAYLMTMVTKNFTVFGKQISALKTNKQFWLHKFRFADGLDKSK